MKGVRLFLALCALTAAGCSGGGPESPDFASVTTVETLKIFAPDSANPATQVDVTDKLAGSRGAGQTLQLSARASISTTVPPGTEGARNDCPTGNDQPQPVSCEEDVTVTDRADWTSNNANIATVDDNGLVTAKSQGTATITAALGGRTAKTTVTVTAPIAVSIDVVPESADVLVNGTQVFRLRATYSDGQTRDVESGTVNWTSSDTTIATVSPSTGISTTATGRAVGSARITATLEQPGSAPLTDFGTLNVSEAILTSVLRVEPANPVIQKGATQQFTAIGRYNDGVERTIPQASVAWTSGTTTVATMSPDGDAGGLATGVAPGQSVITATVTQAGLSPNSASTTLTVTDDLCTGPLLASDEATTVVATNAPCLACSVQDEANAIDADPASVAVMQIQLGLLAGEVSLTAVQRTGNDKIPGGGQAGFLISRPAAIPLSLEVANQLRIATVVRNADGTLTEVESFQQGPDTVPGVLRLTLLGQIGGIETGLVTVQTTAGQDYDGVRVALTTGALTLLSTVNVNSSCATATLPVIPAP